MDELAMALRRSVQPKPAPALWGPFVADMQRCGRDMQTAVQPRVQVLKLICAAAGLDILERQACATGVTIGLGAVCLFALAAFGVREMCDHHAADAALAEAAIPVGGANRSAAAVGSSNQSAAQVHAAQNVAGSNVAALAAQAPAISADGATSTWPREVDLGAGAGAGLQALIFFGRQSRRSRRPARHPR